ncbi:MAG: hypothetical protein ACSNEK_01990 [Parachlamydiaceae bacterium]
MKFFIFSLFLFFSNLEADVVSIKALDADYSEQTLTLKGSVELNHAFGKVLSEMAIFNTNDRAELTKISLQEDVKLILKNQSRLEADQAEIDCQAGKGAFIARNDVKVHFCDPLKYLNIYSFNMRVLWNPTKKKLSTREFDGLLVAEDQVEIHYGQQLSAFGDFASYSEKEIVLTHLNDQELCKITLNGKDKIFSDRVTLLPAQRMIFFSNPSGEIIREEETICFSAKSMHWNDLEQLLVLNEQVKIEGNELGVIEAQGPVTLYLKEQDGARELAKIVCQNDVELAMKDKNKDKHHLLASESLIIDKEAETIEVYSKPNQPAYFKDKHGSIIANHMRLCYSSEDKTPLRLIVDGEVRIVNKFSLNEDNILQYILADLAEYEFRDRELTLSGGDTRVLLYDKLNNLELSAPILKIKRDRITDKDSVSGIGDVRFVFIDQELEKIKNRFQSQEHETRNF